MAVMLSVLGLAGLQAGRAAADETLLEKYAGGAGTQAEPYRIESLADWTALTAAPVDWNKHFVLGNDIDFSGATVSPIGNITTVFTGTLDGDGHVLRNLVLQMVAAENVAVFGYVGASGVISDLGIENATVSGRQFVGALAGRNIGRISGCHVTGVVSGSGSGQAVGGLVGCNYGFVHSCHSACTVTGYDDVGGLAGINTREISESYSLGGTTGQQRVGGLAGLNTSGAITSCHATGPVSGIEQAGGLAGQNDTGGAVTSSYASGAVSGRSEVGGLVGNNTASITACYATGLVNDGSMLGGLAGVNGGTITSCRAEGPVTGDDYLGGLVGINANTGAIASCFATGPVTAEENGGGLAARNAGAISNSYARGDVNGTDGAAGLVYANAGTLLQCYATGKAAGSRAGGLVASVDGGVITTCYWDVNTSGMSASAGGEGRSTTEMVYPHAANTFVGWNFTETWSVDFDYEFNDGYPYLLDNIPPVEGQSACGCQGASCRGEDAEIKMERLFADWLLAGCCLLVLAVTNRF